MLREYSVSVRNMDPTLLLTKRYNSFRDEVPVIVAPEVYRWQEGDEASVIVAPEVYRSQVGSLLVNERLYRKLGMLKDELGKLENLSRLRLRANPYENVGRSIFMDRAGVKMANIDAIFNLTSHTGGYLAQQTAGDFTFCDLAGAPGAWSEYILWRRPESYGFGISLRDGIAWNFNKLDKDNMTISFGPDNTGDLYVNAIAFSEEVRRANVEGVDLVVADGGFNVDGREGEQESLTFNLILSECLSAIKCLREGGSFVVKVYDTVTEESASLLYILSMLFKEICLFKPVTSRPANSERYLVCLKRLSSTEGIEDLENYYSNMGDSSRFSYRRNLSFDLWLSRMNNYHTREQVLACQRILDISGDSSAYRDDLNINSSLCTSLFNIPESSR